MAFAGLRGFARKFSNKCVLEVAKSFKKNYIFNNKNYSKHIITMPPKKKQEATSTKLEEKDLKKKETENNTRPRLQRAAKDNPISTKSESAPNIKKKVTKEKAMKPKKNEEEKEKPKRGRKAKLETVDSVEEVKPKKGKKAAPKKAESVEEAKPKKGKKEETVAKAKSVEDDGIKATSSREDSKPKVTKVKNKTSTDFDTIDFNNCPRKNNKGEEWNLKISNWNVDGIRAWLKKGGLDFFHHEKPDVVCLQETKCSFDKLPPEIKEVEGYKIYWRGSEKEGYAGVALFSKTEPISVQYGLKDENHDDEGRMITAEFKNFYVISVYVPNAGRGLVTLPKRLKWNDSFRNFVAELDKKKPVIICGDMNVAHSEIDLANPKSNTKNAGFTKEEREGMTDFLGDGYIDTFREFYPDKTQAYTFWSYMSNARAKNVGWRLDYFIVSKRLKDSICDNIIRSEVFGSDHCPITLFLHV